VLSPFSSDTFKILTQTARTQAFAGAAAGVTVGFVRGIVSVRVNQLQGGRDVLTEGLTQTGAGAILGVLGALAASAAGVTATAIAGRGVLSIAMPMVASAVVTGSAHEEVVRAVRPWSEGFVRGVSRVLRREAGPEPIRRLPAP
jgi:hypothetical protein